MKLVAILDALRNGAALHFSLVKKPRWELHEDAAITTVSSTQARALIKRGAIVSAGDSLFAGIPSQTWRHAEPSGGAP